MDSLVCLHQFFFFSVYFFLLFYCILMINVSEQPPSLLASQLDQFRKKSRLCCMLLCLNFTKVRVRLFQADMSGERAIRRDEGERLARVSALFHASLTCFILSRGRSLFFSSLHLQEYSVPFMETSAKTGVNVELAFTAVAKYDAAFTPTADHTFNLFSAFTA